MPTPVPSRSSAASQEIKISEVARLAGVSIATVSRVFNHHPNIRPELRQHVLSVAREHGYRPRLSQKQKHVVIITPYQAVGMAQSCVEMILLALTREMPRHGFRLEILPADNFERLHDMQFCAAIAIGLEADSYAGWEDRFPVPLIVLDRQGKAAPPNLLYLHSDEEQGMRLAIEHLYERGRRRIGCIIYGTPGLGNTDLRHRGVQKALETFGLPVEPALIQFSGSGNDRYVELVGKLLQRNVDALFCPGGHGGMVTLYALSLYGRRVPEQVALIATEQLASSPYTVPPLTTISPDYEGMAATVARLLEAHLQGKPLPKRNISLPYRLILRESVDGWGNAV